MLLNFFPNFSMQNNEKLGKKTWNFEVVNQKSASTSIGDTTDFSIFFYSEQTSNRSYVLLFSSIFLSIVVYK